MLDRKGKIPSTSAAGPAFDQRTTDHVIAAIENRIALLDAEIVKAGRADPEQEVALSAERQHLQEFLDDYVSKAKDYHQRLVYSAPRAPNLLWRRLLGKLGLL